MTYRSICICIHTAPLEEDDRVNDVDDDDGGGGLVTTSLPSSSNEVVDDEVAPDKTGAEPDL